MLSTIPNLQRTPKVLNNIHNMIDRFKQLRTLFSTFDQYGNVIEFTVRGAQNKPFANWLNQFNLNLYWVLPVVKNIKKIYNVADGYEENTDILNLNMTEDIENIQSYIQQYESNTLPAETNKYSALYSELGNYFTPFQLINDENSNTIIAEKEVLSNINVVIDNLEDMYSTVFSNNMLRNRRFVISKYNLGETKLDTIYSTSSTMNNVRVKITNNDIMSIKSIMTLPEPTIRFSKINLPGTNILVKSNLNLIFLNYWQLLKTKTRVKNIMVETFKTNLIFHEDTFANSIKNYIVNIPEEEIKNITKLELYKQFINTIVPKIKTIFLLMQKYILDKLSIVDVVGYLEPFLIYTDDITFNQYKSIVYFIDSKITEYNKNMIQYSKAFKILSNVKPAIINSLKAFSIIYIIEPDVRSHIFNESYGFGDVADIENHFTDSELLRKIISCDCLKLYTTTMSVNNLALMFPSNVSELLNMEKNEKNKILQSEEKKNSCNSFIIAKTYYSLEELENDNNNIIYFDKKYDTTNYGVMEEPNKNSGYAEQVINMSTENLKKYIVQQEMKKKHLTEKDANYIAETLINGVKQVVDGQYALLYTGDRMNKIQYYIRKNNKWELNNEIMEKMGAIDENSILCNLQEKCISTTNDKCETIGQNELQLQNSLLQNIIQEFDANYTVSKEKFENEIRDKELYYTQLIQMIRKMETNFLLKYNNYKYKLGINIEYSDSSQIISPYNDLLNIILSQTDFVKKQRDIITFANKFTRPSLPTSSIETTHWLYCIKTASPLLPSFKKELASAFITSPEKYIIVLEQIKSTNGALSDDGDWWTDKYTGWGICPDNFDTDEGYDEGFKVTSREVIEESAGNKILSNVPSKKSVKYITVEANIINNIINALSVSMGIQIESQKDFIIKCVVETIKNTVESESVYKENIKIASQKGKLLPSYKDFYNKSLLFYTFGMYLIAVQTITPPIKTRKTHPGCVRSFVGYPFDGQGDYSSLKYLSCVAYDIRESGEPWNVLKKTNIEKIQNQIKAVIDTILIRLPEVERKILEKTQYLLTNPINTIAEEHDITKWTDFLPPLIPFKIKHLETISDNFKSSLISNLKNGSIKQIEQILTIESKVILFSLAIQEKIQNIIKKQDILLQTLNNEPFLENACCYTNENEPTIDYFINRDNSISQFNYLVGKMMDILYDISSNTEAVLFYSNINTKNIYPEILNTFNEKIIYMAFIYYCKFKSQIPIPTSLLPLCTDKPPHNVFDNSDTIEKIIQNLKDDGRNYSEEQFLRLIQLISRENIVHVQLYDRNISSISNVSTLLENIYEENKEDEVIEQSLQKLLKSSLDTFEFATEAYSKETKNLNNFLIRANGEMQTEIVDFIQKNRGTIKNKHLQECINTINTFSRWEMDDITKKPTQISNNSLYNVLQFYKNYIHNFIEVFPNIIINKVNYDNTYFPNYYGFSNILSNKIKNYISGYFDFLKPFYDTPTLLNVLKKIQELGENIIKLTETTPCFSNIQSNNRELKGMIDERTGRLLFEYYFIRCIYCYTMLAGDDTMIVNEVKETEELTDLYSVDYLEEKETQIDISISLQNKQNIHIISGNKKLLKEKTTELIVAFMNCYKNEKNSIDITYEMIQDVVFKLREGEKHRVTDRLKALTDEERDVDTILKITKQGLYSKGLQKGLTMFDKDYYDKEEELHEAMEKIENKLRKTNKNVNENNIDILMDEYLEQQGMNEENDRDVYDIGFLGENYDDGNYDGVGAPEYGDYADEY
jgi:hypothetical protein